MSCCLVLRFNVRSERVVHFVAEATRLLFPWVKQEFDWELISWLQPAAGSVEEGDVVSMLAFWYLPSNRGADEVQEVLGTELFRGRIASCCTQKAPYSYEVTARARYSPIVPTTPKPPRVAPNDILIPGDDGKLYRVSRDQYTTYGPSTTTDTGVAESRPQRNTPLPRVPPTSLPIRGAFRSVVSLQGLAEVLEPKW